MSTVLISRYKQVWRERPLILLAIVLTMGVVELTWGRQDYGGYNAEPGRLGDFWQKARPSDPQVRCHLLIRKVLFLIRMILRMWYVRDRQPGARSEQ